ncbi:UNVERIFIED_CONTAM: Superfamily II DNA and RNA helicases [Acetivibrio alkalicellulosi]
MISTNEQLIEKLMGIIKNNKIKELNIINDKLTLSVFSQLQSMLTKLNKINIILRESPYTSINQVSREFEITKMTNNVLFSGYDIAQKTTLSHLALAKSMSDFIKNNVNIKKIKNNQAVKSNVLYADDIYAIFGDSSLELNKRNSDEFEGLRMNVEIKDSESLNKIKKSFDYLWNNKEYTEDFKEQLLESLDFIYKDHSPEFCYFYTLYELFGQNLDDVNKFEQDRIGFKNTTIWNCLFKFQKDAVLSAINKIEKYNGCIIADSVGLGKTFEALAVIKYFELRQHKVMVLTPKKLHDNWSSFRNNYEDNEFFKDRFAFDIVNHTDLTRKFGRTEEGLDLERINWGNYDLLVIDESHNFRNRNATNERVTRYDKLLNDIILKGVTTKVLLLSATPVNNSLNDLKNQLSIITLDRDDIFSEEGIKSISNTLVQNQKIINEWNDDENKLKNSLLNRLLPEFYKLLEMISISRSRKHITAYYGTDEIGKFPVKLPPKTFRTAIDQKENLLKFEEISLQVERLFLSAYSPMKYLKIQYQDYYSDLFKQNAKGGITTFYLEDREKNSLILHRFNLFKRMESSIYSFGMTIRRMIHRIDGIINSLEKSIEVEFDEEFDEESEELYFEYKHKIKLDHFDKNRYLNDLAYDKDILENMLKQIDEVLENERDKKLYILKDFIEDKIKNTPYNSGNKKILIFSAFADTAKYLYENLSKCLLDKYSIHSSLITGSEKPKTTLKNIRSEFNKVLGRFSPQSKLKKTLPDSEQIDIVFATDCISEGQNLQDCDCVINYDIQWNPVVLIQRFGRIDRIGSKNNQIAMVNFFPDLKLNDYLNLEARVKGKMVTSNLASSGDEDLLSPELNDFNFRKKHLEKLQNEVVDIDDVSDSISLTDLNMNDYIFDLAVYLKENPNIKKVPKGIYSITRGDMKGAVFCFKNITDNKNEKIKKESPLYPYFIVYVKEDGEIYYENRQAREILKIMRALCYGKNNVDKELFENFNKKTNEANDMSFYSELINKAIASITGEEENINAGSIFDFGGLDNMFFERSSDDYELISFLIIEQG